MVKGKTNVAIQVSYELEGLRDRELRALEGFSSRFPQFKLLLITWDSYGAEEREEGEARPPLEVPPVAQGLLGWR